MRNDAYNELSSLDNVTDSVALKFYDKHVEASKTSKTLMFEQNLVKL